MSTPPEQAHPARRPVLEPTYGVRRRRTEALAALVRELRENESRPPGPVHEPIVVHVAPGTAEEATEQLPPVPGAHDPHGRDARGRREQSVDAGLTVRRAVITLGVTAAALVGFGAALVLPGPGNDDAIHHAPSPPPPAGASAQRRNTDPDGPGTLREGDSGPQVTELQKRLLHIPDVYDHGSTDGRYDATLAAAVARFQLWYGVRGDETGVYGNDTRRDLESRTPL